MHLDSELGLGMPFEDVFHETVLNIVRTANVLTAIGADLFRQFDLTEAQFNVLMALKYREKELTQSDLGRRLLVTRASITSVLDRLESKGLVMRAEVKGNRRIYHVKLTDAGERLLDEVEPVYRQAVHDVLAPFSEGQCRDLIARLERVRENVRRSVDETSKAPVAGGIRG